MHVGRQWKTPLESRLQPVLLMMRVEGESDYPDIIREGPFLDWSELCRSSFGGVN